MSPTVRFNWIAGAAETATWEWFDEFGVSQGTATGQAAIGGVLPPMPDPLTVMLQTALDYASAKGVSFKAVAGTYNAGLPFLNTWDTITIPAQVGTDIEFRNVPWLMRASDGGDGLVFDSSELMNFRFTGGEIFYRGPSVGVRFKPTIRTVTDNNLAINSGFEYLINSVTVQSGGALLPVGQGSAVAAIAYDMTNGPIWANRFRYGQISGHGIAQFGILIINPPAGSQGFRNNDHTINYIMQCKDACISQGLSTAQSALMGSGYWRIGQLFPNSPNATALNQFGQYDLIDCPEIKGPMFRGLCFEPGSTGNRYRTPHVYGASGNNILDMGVGNLPY